MKSAIKIRFDPSGKDADLTLLPAKAAINGESGNTMVAAVGQLAFMLVKRHRKPQYDCEQRTGATPTGRLLDNPAQ